MHGLDVANASELVRRWRARRQDVLRKVRRLKGSEGYRAIVNREARAWETAANELESLYLNDQRTGDEHVLPKT